MSGGRYEARGFVSVASCNMLGADASGSREPEPMLILYNDELGPNKTVKLGNKSISQ